MWGLTNYVDAAPMYCASLKAYVHVTHVITNKIIEALEFIKLAKDEPNKKGNEEQKQKLPQEENKMFL